MVKKLLTSTGIIASLLLSAQKNFWTPAQNVSITGKSGLKERKTIPTEYKLFSLNVSGLKTELNKAPMRESASESLVLKFPNADGKLVDYIVKEAPVLAKELSDKFSGIKSYLGYEKNNSSSSIRFSTSPYEGISVMYFNNSEVSYLDSYTNDLSTYIVYKRNNLPPNPERFNCDFEKVNFQTPVTLDPISLKAPIVKDGQFRTYRLALACTIEYAAFQINRAGINNGTLTEKKAAVLSAMNTTITRVNGIYEKTLSLTLVIVPDNDKIIFIDSDNYDNENSEANGYPLLNQNQSVCDSVIGNANYDIGHVFSTASGGVVSGRVCTSGNKAKGTTGTNSPINDAFDIDFVAHEVGHQFGANHTFRANTGSCSGNAVESTAVEPGGGSTIMAYAGICGGTNNVQTHSDPYFHSVSVNEMYNTISRVSDCSVKRPNNNNIPTADAGSNYDIPYGTAFVLTGTGTDPDGDALTYLWEQIDTASLANNPQPPTATTKAGTVFRSFTPSVNPQRFFPVMTSIANNILTPKWEVIPNVARTFNFSLLVNDNKATGNQAARATMKVFVANTGPFKVTSQAVTSTYIGGSDLNVTWDVAGTNVAPINTQNVQILISSDNGKTYPTILADVPNNGSATVVLPNEDNPNARIMVKAVNNIYFAVNIAKLAITKNLAVNESALNKGFAIYPNPVKGEVNISLNNAAKGATYQILDLSGKLISNGSLENEKTKVNISTLKTGTYRIVISNNGETTSKNLIVK